MQLRCWRACSIWPIAPLLRAHQSTTGTRSALSCIIASLSCIWWTITSTSKYTAVIICTLLTRCAASWRRWLNCCPRQCWACSRTTMSACCCSSGTLTCCSISASASSQWVRIHINHVRRAKNSGSEWTVNVECDRASHLIPRLWFHAPVQHARHSHDQCALDFRAASGTCCHFSLPLLT